MKRHPLVIAHRGASRERPENTFPAFELAIAQRADMIEIDLHRTRDGHIVVAHDERLPGRRRGARIAEATLEEVRAADAGLGERVPTLPEVLDAFGSRIPFNLEIKSGRAGDDRGLEVAALGEIEQRGLRERTLFSSFSDGVLSRLREASALARLGVLVSPRAPERWLARAEAVGAESVHLWKGLARFEAVEAAHAAGLAVLAYTVDEEAEMRTLLERGVDGLFTNVPALLRARVDAGFPVGHRTSAE